MVCDGFGVMGMWLSLGVPRMQRMSCHRHTMHVHVVGRHVCCINHSGIVLGSGVLVLGIHKGIASCVFLKLEYKHYFVFILARLDYLMYNIVVLGYA